MHALTFKAQSEFESTLLKRDGGCVVTGTSPDQCLKSHIVPEAVINVYLHFFLSLTPKARAGMIDGYYVESYDPATAIMLCPDIDRMFNAFQCSAYMGVSSI